jgi:adenylate cyclase, class 2
MSHLNVEIKARCTNSNRIEAFLKNQNARFVGIDHQIDTYFNTPNGRLKLREGNIENALIYYNRNNQAGPKQSDIILHPVTEGVSLKEILTQTLGVKVVVDKKRKIYFIENVKFHIDKVEGLGSFVEIEAIDANGEYGYDKLLEQCNLYIQLLKIREEDLLTDSYSDMLLKHTS